MNFRTFGPFPIALDEHGNIPQSMNEFWKSVNSSHTGLSEARGCYVFGINSSGSKRILPWYVGMTNRQSFEFECFKSHQRNHYSRAINHYRRARAHLYVIAQLAESGKFYRGTAGKAIMFLETYLIGFALYANEDLLNKRDTKLYRELVVPGFLNSKTGNPGKPATELRRTFYFDLAAEH